MEQVIKKWELILNIDKGKDITYGRKVLEEMLDDFVKLNLPVVGVTLPTGEQIASDMDEICFKGAQGKSDLDKRQFLEYGFMLGYNYLKNKINGN